MMQKKTNTLVFIVGPTAVGKTSCALYLAKKLKGAILNCDSVQLYKDLLIGSARLRQDEAEGVSLLMHGVWPSNTQCSAGDFEKEAFKHLRRELKVHHVFAVGGSGFYIQALEKGMYPAKPTTKKIQDLVKSAKERKGEAYLYDWLVHLDPQSAQKISPQDTYRVMRALCLILSEKKPLSLIHASFKPKKLDFPSFKIGLKREKEDLYCQVEQRVQKMLKSGLIGEVEGLLKKGLENWPLLQSVGYKETVKYLKGKLTKKELEEAMIKRTWALVKKQIKWFKRDKNICWYNAGEKDFYKTIYHDVCQKIT